MEILRTPDDRFVDLPGYPFAPHYVEVAGDEGPLLRMHFIDEGRREAAPILCLHGQPTWSFLYRHMIPLFAAAGQRVVAPDLVGFGRSDKPTRRDDYTYARHVAWTRAFVEALDLRRITLVCQDWGGLIGLRLVAEMPERFARVVAANTGLPDGVGIPEDAAPMMHALYDSLPVITPAELGQKFLAKDGPPAFLYWQKLCAESPELRIGDIMRAAGLRDASPRVIAAYEAPFPDQRFVAGARQFPTLVPIMPDNPAIPDNRRAWEALRRFERPFLTAFSDGDPVTRGAEKRLQAEIPGARNQTHVTIHGAGHFLQEERGEELARTVLDFIARTPAP